MPGAYLILALLFGAAPPLFRRLSWPKLAAIVLAAAAAGIAGSVAGFAPYPWTDLVGTAVAIAGGVLLGRAVPARFRPLAVLLIVLAAFDSIQVFAASSDGAEPAWRFYSMLVVATPWFRSDIGVADLLLIVAISEHLRRRKAHPAIAVAPGLIGLGLADAFSAWHPGGLPLVPFLLAGLVLTEPWARRFLPLDRDKAPGAGRSADYADGGDKLR